VYLADTDEQAFALARPRVESNHLLPGMLQANRLVAEAGFFGPRNPELLQRFQTMGTHAPLSLEKQLELGMLLCGGPETVIDQSAECASGAGRWRDQSEFRNGRQQRRDRANHAPVRS
jgi:hypothetical protein